jgi:hypothetical protein
MSSNGDLIETLPTDDSVYNKQIANILFKEENASVINTLTNEFKDGVIISFLFILFSSQQVDNFIIRMIPSTQNNYVMLMAIKCVSITILFYIAKNFQFSRKS